MVRSDKLGSNRLEYQLDVKVFSPQSLCKIISSAKKHLSIKSSDVAKKPQIQYLNAYLEREQAKTIVIENEYTDKYYLQDYIDYHVRSYNDYGRTCVRFHFFDSDASKHGSSFNKQSLVNFLRGDSRYVDSDSLQDGYLGFVVIRPLHNSIIGRTCLRVYKSTAQLDNGSRDKERRIQVVKSVKVNLCGIPLIIEETLPFQEQDRVVSACATSALWSYFHGVSSSNKLMVPSPSEITQVAESYDSLTQGVHDVHHGLTPSLIYNSIQDFGLEYKEFKVRSLKDMREVTYGYQRYNNEPMMLGVDVYSRVIGQDGKEFWKYRDAHLVTIVGFGSNKEKELDPTTIPVDDKRDCSTSWAIECFYCHDDQTGPFARMDIDNIPEGGFYYEESYVAKSESAKEELICNGDKPNLVGILRPIVKVKNVDSNRYENSVEDQIYVPRTIHFGIYKQIRNHLSEAFRVLSTLDATLINYPTDDTSDESWPYFTLEDKCFWDFGLFNVKDYKELILENILKNKDSLEINKLYSDILSEKLPHFFWRLCFFQDKSPVFDVLVDATELDAVNYGLLRVVPHDLEFFQKLNEVRKIEMSHCEDKELSAESLREGRITELFWNIVFSVVEKDEKKDFADQFFGGLVRPEIIYESEMNHDFSVKKPKVLYKLSEENIDISISKLNSEVIYLWLVTDEGSVLLAEEEEVVRDGVRIGKLGHPTLNDGDPARIAGEIKVENGSWIINNESGRYSYGNQGREKRHLENVKSQLERYGFIEGLELKVRHSPVYGASKVYDGESFIDAIGIRSTETLGGINIEYVNSAFISMTRGEEGTIYDVFISTAKLLDKFIKCEISVPELGQLCFALCRFFNENTFKSYIDENIHEFEKRVLELIDCYDRLINFCLYCKEVTINGNNDVEKLLSEYTDILLNYLMNERALPVYKVKLIKTLLKSNFAS